MKERFDYYKSDEFLAILKQYEDCEKKNIPCIISSEDYADIAEYYDSKGLANQALRTINTAIDIYPGEIYPLALRTRFSIIHHHDTQEAKYYASQIEDKSNMEYHYLMAEISVAENHTQEADQYLEKVCQDVDEDEMEETILDIASLFADYEEYETAWKWLQRLTDKDDDEEYLSLLGRTLEGIGKHDESQKVFNKLIDKNPFSTEYWDNLAASQYNQKKFHESISSSEYSVAVDPDNAEAILNIANGLYTLGNFQQALSFYERFCSIKPDDEYGEMFHGICLLNLDRYEEALEHLLNAERNAATDSSNLSDIYQEIAYAKNKLGDLDGALAYLGKAQALKGNNPDLMVLKGQFYLENGRTDSAQECFNKAILESNSSQEVFYRIAIAAYEAGYINMAAEMLDILYKSKHWDKGHSYMAVCKFILGDTDAFYQHLQKAVEQDRQEAKFVLGYLFPDGMDPSDYYQYALSNF